MQQPRTGHAMRSKVCDATSLMSASATSVTPREHLTVAVDSTLATVTLAPALRSTSITTTASISSLPCPHRHQHALLAAAALRAHRRHHHTRTRAAQPHAARHDALLRAAAISRSTPEGRPPCVHDGVRRRHHRQRCAQQGGHGCCAAQQQRHRGGDRSRVRPATAAQHTGVTGCVPPARVSGALARCCLRACAYQVEDNEEEGGGGDRGDG